MTHVRPRMCPYMSLNPCLAAKRIGVNPSSLTIRSTALPLHFSHNASVHFGRLSITAMQARVPVRVLRGRVGARLQ